MLDRFFSRFKKDSTPPADSTGAGAHDPAHAGPPPDDHIAGVDTSGMPYRDSFDPDSKAAAGGPVLSGPVYAADDPRLKTSSVPGSDPSHDSHEDGETDTDTEVDPPMPGAPKSPEKRSYPKHERNIAEALGIVAVLELFTRFGPEIKELPKETVTAWKAKTLKEDDLVARHLVYDYDDMEHWIHIVHEKLPQLITLLEKIVAFQDRLPKENAKQYVRRIRTIESTAGAVSSVYKQLKVIREKLYAPVSGELDEFIRDLKRITAAKRAEERPDHGHGDHDEHGHDTHGHGGHGEHGHGHEDEHSKKEKKAYKNLNEFLDGEVNKRELNPFQKIAQGFRRSQESKVVASLTFALASSLGTNESSPALHYVRMALAAYGGYVAGENIHAYRRERSVMAEFEHYLNDPDKLDRHIDHLLQDRPRVVVDAFALLTLNASRQGTVINAAVDKERRESKPTKLDKFSNKFVKGTARIVLGLGLSDVAEHGTRAAGMVNGLAGPLVGAAAGLAAFAYDRFRSGSPTAKTRNVYANSELVQAIANRIDNGGFTSDEAKLDFLKRVQKRQAIAKVGSAFAGGVGATGFLLGTGSGVFQNILDHVGVHGVTRYTTERYPNGM